MWRALRRLSLAAGDELSRRLEAFLADPRHVLIQQRRHPHPHPHPHPHLTLIPTPTLTLTLIPTPTLAPKQAQAAGAMHLASAS